MAVNPFSIFRGLLLGLGLGAGLLSAAAQTNAAPRPIPDPTLLETPGAAANSLSVHPAASAILPAPTPAPIAAPVSPAPAAPPVETGPADNLGVTLIVFSALAGFLLYQCGLTRAKNCAHTSILLLVGTVFGLAGYWMGGFAVQTGGIGDTHAALAGPWTPQERGALDHELGLMAGGHYWGFMGSAGFFLLSDDAARAALAGVFLAQAALVALAVAAALGAALERARLLGMAVLAFLTGAVIYPLMANWVWGGGWLAGLGREFSLGHGVVDLAGAGVVHETAGTLALVIALVVGPRHGRFGRNRLTGIPGHHVPFAILGALVLLVAFIASAAGTANWMSAATNVLLGAVGGMVVSVFWGAWRGRRATPWRLCRGLLGGAVALCGGGAFFDSWAAVLTGACAALLVEGAAAALERHEIDDPAYAVAIHGAAGAWGLLAVGFFANGAGGRGLNGVEGPVRGLFFGGGWHQLAAQVIGVAVDFAVVFVLGYLAALAVQKILGLRVKLADELQGLDWPQVGALGYQPDVESE